MQKQGLEKNDVVDIYGYYKGEERVARKFIVVDYDIAESSVATYYPETNVLVPVDFTADGSNQPASKSIIVKLKKASWLLTGKTDWIAVIQLISNRYSQQMPGNV